MEQTLLGGCDLNSWAGRYTSGLVGTPIGDSGQIKGPRVLTHLLPNSLSNSQILMGLEVCQDGLCVDTSAICGQKFLMPFDW